MTNPSCFLLLPVCLALACAGAPTTRPKVALPVEAPPAGRLSADVKPLAYALALTVDPRLERFSGAARIDVELARPTRVIWLHGRGLDVSRARVVRAGVQIQAAWAQVDDEGLARLTVAQTLDAGQVTLELEWSARFDPQVAGLYRVTDGGENYAFTQFEPLFARRCFPSFDEPGFKATFDVTLRVPGKFAAISNGTIESESPHGESREVKFTRTPPLPSYLVAFAVGPFDIVTGLDLPASAVRARPLPLRGIATKGKGPRLAWSLARVGGILAKLETYFGVAYPFEKLDLLAVPDFAAGAMENAGAITFREWLLLIDGEDAPANQKRAFAGVLAHELAHQWFGDLVTMTWWDDLWLNEAFASWIGTRAVAEWDPSTKADVLLLQDVHGAMLADSLAAARSIRQPIASNHDIHNAFDGLTYDKGAAVLGMFERWAGPEKFRAGIKAYLEKYRFGSATAADFLASVSLAAGKDLAAPFRTFLDQPGVPLVQVAVKCEGAPRVIVRQSRSLPLASTADRQQTWQIPLCLRFEAAGRVREQCALVTKAEEEVVLDGGVCPTWLLPNADAAGYYTFALGAGSMQRLTTLALPKLSVREQLAITQSLRAAFAGGQLTTAELVAALAPFASSPERLLAQAPMESLRFAHEQLVPETLARAVESYSRSIYASRRANARFIPAGESAGDDEAKLLRRDLMAFMLEVGRDPLIRGEAKKRGLAYLGYKVDGKLHPEAVDSTLADLAVITAMEEGDVALFEAIVKTLRVTTDAAVRRRLLTALGHARGPAADRALALILDPEVRPSEMGTIYWQSLGMKENRDTAWTWLQANFDAVVAKMPTEYVGSLPWAAAGLCSQDAHAEIEAFFKPRIDKLPGGPRNLAGSLEANRLCAAQVAAHAAGALDFFGGVN